MENNCKRPQVLLIGNGINRSYNGDSWERLIKEMSGNLDFKSSLPMPQQIIVATGNDVNERLKQYKSRLFGEVHDKKHRELLQSILTMGFDEILTTNYSYELELASVDCAKISEYAIGKMKDTTLKGKRAEAKYMLHTYNAIDYLSTHNRVWHIHGEARNHSSMVIGHYYYCNLVSKIKRYFDGIGNKYEIIQSHNKKININSWLDAFILGDVYVLGFGFDPSEIDLWWLLERKVLEKANKGKVYYYCPPWEFMNSKNDDKHALLVCHDVVMIGRDIVCRQNDYKDFYRKSIEDIKMRVEIPKDAEKSVDCRVTTGDTKLE
ncbi:MAG: hypothetical protein IK111_07955 [Lachnospiraceae bacterium]|nr:hypothetical protein [Lachnospiraceae bacterium]